MLIEHCKSLHSKRESFGTVNTILLGKHTQRVTIRIMLILKFHSNLRDEGNLERQILFGSRTGGRSGRNNWFLAKANDDHVAARKIKIIWAEILYFWQIYSVTAKVSKR